MLHEVVLALAIVAAPQEGSGGGTTPALAAAAPARASADTVARGERTIVQRPAGRFLAPPASPWSGGVAPPASPKPPAADTPTTSASATSPGVAAADSPGVHRRPRAVVYSDWYGRRLAMHRVMSYALLPLLAAQYYTGTQLMAKGADAPLWVIRTHAPLATASAVLFGANTVTGIWNLWDARKDPNGRFSRTAHGLLMLAADAGFLAAGSMGHPAVQNGSIRSLHRTIALSSMGVALVSYAIMLPPFRR